jgi:UDPglucose--hexose-1-phosphate uridylyltransferase
MSSNQLRNDPTSGHWVVIVPKAVELNLKKIHPKQSVTTYSCSFCEGKEKETPTEIFAVRNSNTAANSPGWQIRVIPDQEPIFQIHGETNSRAHGIYDIVNSIGAHEIVIESPRHDENFFTFSEIKLNALLQVFQFRIKDLKLDLRFVYILAYKHFHPVHKHKHPYSYILATPITPRRVKDELLQSQQYFQYKNRCLFCDIIHQELGEKTRIIAQNDYFVALSPFASRSPFEVWIAPLTHETFFEENTHTPDLAKILHLILQKLQILIPQIEFNLVIHTGPNKNSVPRLGYWRTLERDFHWHIEIEPNIPSLMTFREDTGFVVNFLPPEKATEILIGTALNS